MVTTKKSASASGEKTVTKKASAPKKTVAKRVAPKKVTSAKAKEVKREEITEVGVPSVAKKTSVKTIPAGERYLYAVGRRKTAVAQVRLYPVKAGTETAHVAQGGKTIFEYFGTDSLVNNALSPLKVTGQEEMFSVSLLVRGGGKHGQSDAAKLGVARALLEHDPLLRSVLKAEGMLTRDSRSVERKKPGLKKARKSPQWSKR